MCYTVGPCWLSILNIAVCTCQTKILKEGDFFLMKIQLFPDSLAARSTHVTKYWPVKCKGN